MINVNAVNYLFDCEDRTYKTVNSISALHLTSFNSTQFSVCSFQLLISSDKGGHLKSDIRCALQTAHCKLLTAY